MARSQHSDLTCSFCGKSQPKVRKLIAGPTAYICDECVDLCNAIFAKDDSEVPALAELNGMTLLAFLREYMQGKPVDSITVSELRDALAVEREKRLPTPPQESMATPVTEPARRCELTEAQAALLRDAEARIGRGERVRDVLPPLSDLPEGELTAFLSKQYGIPTVDLNSFEIDPEVMALVPEETQRRHVLVPVNRAGSSLIVAMADPSNVYAIDDLKFMTNLNVEVVVASEAQIRRKVDKHFPRPH